VSYTTTLKVRFGDIDHAGIAYYPNLYHYLHIAFEEFFESHVGIPYPDLLDKERIGFPTVSVTTDFEEPIRYGDILSIRITVTRIGISSVEILFEAAKKEGSPPCLVSRQTLVAVDMRTFRPIPIPPRLKESFARCAPDLSARRS
jgi:4-hydroxybenzoyl-CoA thioesterase